MDFPIVAIVHVRERGGDTTFRHHGVRFPEKRFANKPYRHTSRRSFDRSAQARATCADYENVVLKSLILGHEMLLAINPMVSNGDAYYGIFCEIKKRTQIGLDPDRINCASQAGRQAMDLMRAQSGIEWIGFKNSESFLCRLFLRSV